MKPCSDGLPHELHCHIPGMFGGVMTVVYCNGQQNVSISSRFSRRVVALPKKDTIKENVMDTCVPSFFTT